MNIETRIASFVELGSRLGHYEQDETLMKAVQSAEEENPWFTPDFIRYAMFAWSSLLDARLLTEWIRSYRDRFPEKPQTIGVVMAGNIPMVGFHDMLCVLLTGHRLLAKVSSQDRRLLPAIGELLSGIHPGWKERIAFTEERLDRFDAVIATGSNNTSRYFDYYFGKYPHIIRRNRNSAAILDGSEPEEELRRLSQDLFLYFGLGCRNVSRLLLPDGFDLERLRKPFSRFEGIISHHKYCNNYDYQKAVMMVNKAPFTDLGFCLLVPSPALPSPVSVIHYGYYSSKGEAETWLDREKDQIQCVAAQGEPAGNRVPFGETQLPRLHDYADGIDTLEFLCRQK